MAVGGRGSGAIPRIVVAGVVFASLTAGVAPAGVSPAGAVANVVGFTWYADGAFSKTGSSGTVIRAYATQGRPNKDYLLSFAPTLPSGEACPDANKQTVNPNVRRSSSSGLIGNTAGAVTGPPGNYQICFYEVGATSASATSPLFLTII